MGTRTQRTNRRTRLAALIAASAALGFALPAAATTAMHCVGTVAELQSALSTLNNDANARLNGFDLRIRSGFYALPGGITIRNFFTKPADTYRVSGRWNSGCSAQTYGTGTTSVIDAGGTGTALLFNLEELAPPVGQTIPAVTGIHFDVDNLTLFAAAACLNFQKLGMFQGAESSEFSADVENNRFEQCGRTSISTDEGALVRNNFFTGNTAQGNVLGVLSPTYNYIYNNTFRDNSSSSEIEVFGNAAARIANNVIWESTSTVTVKVPSSELAFVSNNVLDAGKVSGPVVLSSNFFSNPRFASASGATLASDSPLRDVGNGSLPNGVGSRDVSGNVRVQNGTVDIGAYELAPPPVLPDNLFANGFD